MRAGRWAVAGLALAGCLGCAAAQETPTPAVSQSSQHARQAAKKPMGAVSGTVYCADTNMPARLARVMLIPVGGGGGDDSSLSFRTAMETDLEGRFTMSKVPEGTYYVQVQFPGYRKPLPLARISAQKPLTADETKSLGPDAPKITVATKQTATVSIRLERGAEIDGTVLYDDGSPGVGLHITVHPKSAKNPAASGEPENPFGEFADFTENATDDHGRFRILGLAPGEYTVGIAVPTGSAENSSDSIFSRIMDSSPLGALMVYYGNTMRESKAEAIKLGENDSSKDADITIPLSKLHMIRGHVIFKSNGEAPATAALELAYADNRETARVFLATDGEFAIAYVPEGNYILRAQGMKERLPTFEDEDSGGEGFQFQTHSFIAGSPGKNEPGNALDEGAEVPVVVAGDVTGLTISVPDPPAVKAVQPSAAPGGSGAATAPPQ